MLQGGGGLVGADFEFLIFDNVGISLGVGLVLYGASLHIHNKTSINSSSIALNYWHQGIEESFIQGAFGPSYVFRFGKLFSAQLGIAKIIQEGPGFQAAYSSFDTTPEVILIYSLVIYL